MKHMSTQLMIKEECCFKQQFCIALTQWPNKHRAKAHIPPTKEFDTNPSTKHQ